MIPGHIRAHPLDPRHRHVALRTSASAYLPGQLITVTVRSTRDFMGFLLQARGVDADSVRTGSRVKSTSLGPVLLGGSWTLAPPGTHTLHCLSEGDTLTHSDKQLKRNLSFVWRAPDVPMGDFRFYITVVQSYFVYWAGIESAVVSDGTRHHWSRNNVTSSPLQGDEVTSLPALRSHRASYNQLNITPGPDTSPRPSTTRSGRGSPGYKSLEPPNESTHPVLEGNNSSTLASLEVGQLPNQAVKETSSPVHSGFPQTKGNTIASTGSYPVTEETRTDPRRPVTFTNVPKSSVSSSAEVELTTTFLPHITSHNPMTVVSKTKLEDPELSAVLETRAPILNIRTTATPSTSPSFHKTHPTRYATQNPEEKIHISAETNEVPSHPEPATTARSLTSQDQPRSSTRNPKPFQEGIRWTLAMVSQTTEETSYVEDTNPNFDSAPRIQVPESRPQNQRGPIHGKSSSAKSTIQTSSSQPLTTGLSESRMINDTMNTKSKSHNPELQTWFHFQTSSNKSLSQVVTSPSNPPFKTPSVTSQIFPFFQEPTSTPGFKFQSSSPNLIRPSKFTTRQSPTTSSHMLGYSFSLQSLLNKLFVINSDPRRVGDLSKHQPEDAPSTAPVQTPPAQKDDFPQTDEPQPDTSLKPLSIAPQPRSKNQSPTRAAENHIFGWKHIQTSATPQSIRHLTLTSSVDQTLTPSEAGETKDDQYQANIRLTSSSFHSTSSTTSSHPLSTSDHPPTRHSSSLSSTDTLPASTSSSVSSSYQDTSSVLVKTQSPSTESSFPSFSTKTKPQTTPAISAVSSPSPISMPPLFSSVQPPPPSPTLPSSEHATKDFMRSQDHNDKSSVPMSSSVPSSTSSVTNSATSPLLSSSLSIATSFLFIFSPTPSTSTNSPPSNSSPLSPPHPEPSSVPHHPPTSSSSSSTVPSQKFTFGHRKLIQNHIPTLHPESNLNLPTPENLVHPNPLAHPKLDPNFESNLGHKLKPNLPNTDTKPKPPSNSPGTPDKEGKYPDIIPRHSAWELGMLLGGSAGLGMVLVVGVRYMYRQSCGKRTGVTLHDREREYSRGERGLIHVQECGDLVRVRRLRDNSFVLLAEYDILTAPGD
ncbi:uncharacterized protein V6R79_023257 [Siganus canaliculatus]